MQITEPNRFIECVIAPGYTQGGVRDPDDAAEVEEERAACCGPGRWRTIRPRALDYRRVDGGLLVQTRDAEADDFATAKVVTKRAPTDAELADLHFAWLVSKHVKSNAIVLAKDGMVVGVGAGQMSRVDSTHMAVRKAGERVKGSVLASDAFFPFRDNVDEAAPGGRHGDRAARRLGARPGVDRRLRRARPGDGVHRRAALPPLSPNIILSRIKRRWSSLGGFARGLRAKPPSELQRRSPGSARAASDAATDRS